MMWWLVWCAVVLVCRTAAAPASDNLQLQTLDLAQLDPPAPDDENLGYYPAPGGRYSGSPWLYLLSDAPRDSQINTGNSEVIRRPGRSLAVNPAFELLQRNAENAFWGRVVNNNREYLDKVGKRDFPKTANGDENGLLEDTEERRTRPKRKMPSLSINNPMEVLRQRLLLEVARKQMREASQRQAFANRVFLQNVGKRGYWAKSVSPRARYYN